ncbi:MAG: iron-sulfur cluster repair di-iron protein [Candidatus Marinimicrobia bacterium]|nr:iron-sulfur cluster repair di-iron protein [Candidatus Neomarinimicrobiota bacterium]
MGEIQGEIRHKSVGQLVSDDFRSASVFKSFDIDYCCGGKKTLEQACKENDLEIVGVVTALNEVVKQPKGSGIDYRQWKLDFLCDYIVNTHHAYVNNAIDQISMDIVKVLRAHGSPHPELLEIKACFDQLSSELTTHMKKEEIILFPYIKKMVQDQNSNQNPSRPPFGSIQNPINAMETEHVGAGKLIARIRNLSNDYTVPADGCTTYGVTLAGLHQFEEDLHQHIHLENNILFPSAIKLEKEIFGSE